LERIQIGLDRWPVHEAVRPEYKCGDMGEAEFLPERGSIQAEISQAKALPQMPTQRALAGAG